VIAVRWKLKEIFLVLLIIVTGYFYFVVLIPHKSKQIFLKNNGATAVFWWKQCLYAAKWRDEVKKTRVSIPETRVP
jgi:hypothetical protein